MDTLDKVLNRISDEDKERVFQIYMGQTCVYTGTDKPFWNYGYQPKLTYTNFMSLFQSSTRALFLDDISNITDEHAIEYAAIFGLTGDDIKVVRHKDSYMRTSIVNGDDIENRIIIFDGFYALDFKSYQFFVSKGYAMPYMNYTVDDLVRLNVYKIKERK